MLYFGAATRTQSCVLKQRDIIESFSSVWSYRSIYYLMVRLYLILLLLCVYQFTLATGFRISPSFTHRRVTNQKRLNLFPNSVLLADGITASLGIDAETVQALNELQDNVPSPYSGNLFVGKSFSLYHNLFS